MEGDVCDVSKRPCKQVAGTVDARMTELESLRQGLRGDPNWQKLRVETNSERKMVLKYEISLMHQAEAADVVAQLHGHGTGASDMARQGYRRIDRLCRVDLRDYARLLRYLARVNRPTLAYFLT
jgi:hypothetical protein